MGSLVLHLVELLGGSSELALRSGQLSGVLCLGIFPGRAQLALLRLEQRMRPCLLPSCLHVRGCMKHSGKASAHGVAPGQTFTTPSFSYA